MDKSKVAGPHLNGLRWFLRTVGRKSHKLQLKTTQLYCSTILEGKKSQATASAAPELPVEQRGVLPRFFLAYGGLPASWGVLARSSAAQLLVSVLRRPSPCACVFRWSPRKDIGHLTPVWPRFHILYLQHPFSNTATFWALESWNALSIKFWMWVCTGVSGLTYQLITTMNYFENYNTEILLVFLLLNIYTYMF